MIFCWTLFIYLEFYKMQYLLCSILNIQAIKKADAVEGEETVIKKRAIMKKIAVTRLEKKNNPSKKILTYRDAFCDISHQWLPKRTLSWDKSNK